jgi:flagellar capping protein FliD
MIRGLRMTVVQLKKRMDSRFTRLQRQMNARFSAVDVRFDSMDRRFESIDRRFESMEQRFDSRFATLERHLSSLGEKLDSIARGLNEKTDVHWAILHEHENRLKELESAERTRSSATD